MWSILIILLGVLNLQQSAYGDPQVPCLFIFGDSLADSGNNNPLSTQARANYPPYGVDFRLGSTGRFSNGRTMIDIIGELLGFDSFIPSFPNSLFSDILKGVNYASGSAGIRDESGQHLGVHMSMNMQLTTHLMTILRIKAKFGNSRAASELLNKCLYYVGMGSNDYINNYFMPEHYPTSSLYSPEQYAQILIDQYSHQIKKLYDYGARKVALIGLGLIGCTPQSIGKYGTNGSFCVDKMNLAAFLFNDKLIGLVDQLNKEFPDAKFIYINSANSTSTGFKVLNVGCCEVSDIGQCVPFKKPCDDRDDYVFWDSFHPTEAVNHVAARRAYKAVDPSDAYPFDISSLVGSGTAEAM